MSRTARLPPVYLLPCRIQQGWGDVAEMARAAQELHRAGFPLAYYRGRPGRDRRAEAVDPRRSPVRFPPVRRWKAPPRAERALVLATWWGLTGRARDSHGGPVPGTVAEPWEAILRAHDEVLTVSLEEFGSARTSREAVDEGLRQAGWSAARRRAHLAGPTGRSDVRRWHASFERARGGDRPDILHVAGTFWPSRAAAREFPFLLPWIPAWSRSAPSPPDDASAGPAVLVYGGELPVDPLVEAVLASPPPHERPGPVWVRGGQVSPVLRRAPVVPLEWQAPRAWERRRAAAGLQIVSGSLSLVEAVDLGRPFLYFNGWHGRGRLRRGFRREKLLSLVRGLRQVGAPTPVVQDLLSFADGRRVHPVLLRARSDPRWRTDLTASLARLRRAAQGRESLAARAERWAHAPEGVAEWVKGERDRGSPLSS